MNNNYVRQPLLGFGGCYDKGYGSGLTSSSNKSGFNSFESQCQRQSVRASQNMFESNSNNKSNMKSFYDKYGNIRWLGVALFVVASVYCLYVIFRQSGTGAPPKYTYVTRLKLVNVFDRHGDRSPSDGLPESDPHMNHTDFFWPNGLQNLTDLGKYRQFRIGLELRHRYGSFMDYSASSVLAFSSPVWRCHESLVETLRGLYNLDTTLDVGRTFMDNCHNVMNDTCYLPAGSGSPSEWSKIRIDTETIPTLTFRFLNDCPYRVAHPSSIDSDLNSSESIAQLKGTQRLAKLLKDRYDVNWNFTALGLWSTLASEVRLIATKETYKMNSHLYDWIGQRVPEYVDSSITMFDLFEQVALLGYRDRLAGEANYIQLTHILGSLIGSQSVALNETQNELYANKRMVLYSTHDTILQHLMHQLKLINADAKLYEKKFNKWNRKSRKFDQVRKDPTEDLISETQEYEANYDEEKLLDGLKMSSFGMSLVFELFEIERIPTKVNQDPASKVTKFAYMQAALYNKEDAKNYPVLYKRIDLGKACQQMFHQQYPNESWSHYYEFGKYKLNHDRSCPFNLFRNVTSKWQFDEKRMSELCAH